MSAVDPTAPGEAELAQWLGAPTPLPVSMLDASSAPACLAGAVDAGAFEDAADMAAGRALGEQYAPAVTPGAVPSAVIAELLR